jgi:hypothetical protein
MRTLHLLAAAALLGGCGTAGAFGQATMFKECGSGDPTCRRATPAAPIAVGARLRPQVSVDVAGSVMPLVALSSSRDDVVAIEQGALVAKAPGMAAVLIATADGTVIDFQHVWVAEPTAIVVERTTDAGLEELVGPLELVPGDEVMLNAALLGGAQRLAGEGDLEWKLDGDAIALLRDGSSGRRRLVARKAGAAHVTIASLGLSTTFDIEVMP